MVDVTSRSGKHSTCLRFAGLITRPRRETVKRLLALPPDTAMIWKSHDDSIAQRSAIDQARQDKHSSNGQNHASKRRDTIHEEASTVKAKGTS